MKLPGKKTQWAFRNKDMRRHLKKKELREEEKRWHEEVLDVKSGCTIIDCVYPDCDCSWNEELD